MNTQRNFPRITRRFTALLVRRVLRLPMMVAFVFMILPARGLDWIRVAEDGSRFARGEDGTPFLVWGVNYDHTEEGKLLEEFWHDAWSRVVEDFGEIKALGANVVRVHLQFEKFIVNAAGESHADNLERLRRLLELAESLDLYLDITGLGCYRKSAVPEWYDALPEQERWEMQARFWEAVAKTCKESPAVYCYDLMNEPILAAPKDGQREWLTGELGGYHFVQRLTLDLAGRSQKEVAEAWTRKLTDAIRKHDRRHLITVGVIPWVHVFPNAKPLFYSPEVGKHLDFASVHFYPKAGEVEAALTALAAYDVGKPLVVEEMFPLNCSIDELITFIDGSKKQADGWISFYWGTTAEQYRALQNDLAAAIKGEWLERFREKGAKLIKK